MIKQIIACLSICLIITGLISPVFSDASALPQPNWSDPGISEIINISDLTGWMLNGGTFDVSQYTDAESFMNDYFNARTKTRLISPGEDAEDYYEVLPGFGINNQLVSGDSFARPLDTNRVIASSFRDHTGYGRRLSNKVNDALLSSGSLYDMKIPLLNEVEFANFVGYNHDALKLYSEFFTSNDNIPAPDPLYLDICRNISGTLLQFTYNNQTYYVDYSADIYYYQISSGYGPYKVSPQFPFSVCTSLNKQLICTDIGTINLISDGSGGYDATYNFPNKICFYNHNNVAMNYANTVNYRISNADSNHYIQQVILQTLDYQTFDIGSIAQDHFDGLSIAMNYLNDHFRNINLYVDGVLWALSSSKSNSTLITPEFPDAVGGEDLPNTTWPISRPRAPYYTSVPGMLQAIEHAIQDDGKLDIDDLKPYLTDENGDPVPDPVFDPEPVPIPVPDPVNPDVVPGLPILPAMPPDMPGFSGVSVLAEIINFTNQSLPTSLIVTFWGIVFGIVILGLIKILHK